MSAEKGEKKKGGKLPIVLVLALVLGGGGFFMMKGKGAKPEPPPVVAGETHVLEQFLVNLADGEVYLRTDIALTFDKKFDKHAIEEATPIARDTINMVLTSKRLSDLRTLAGKQELKKELAREINKRLHAMEAEHAEAEGKAPPKKKKKKKKADEDEHATDEEEIPEGWDSAEGPVIKVLFSSFATQAG